MTDNPSYHVFLRFPFSRGGFVEPAQTEWTLEKEQKLWSIISRAKNRSEIKWSQLADDFSTSIPFLLQQAAWLYERELQRVHEEMQRVTSQSVFPTQSTIRDPALSGIEYSDSPWSSAIDRKQNKDSHAFSKSGITRPASNLSEEPRRNLNSRDSLVDSYSSLNNFGQSRNADYLQGRIPPPFHRRKRLDLRNRPQLQSSATQPVHIPSSFAVVPTGSNLKTASSRSTTSSPMSDDYIYAGPLNPSQRASPQINGPGNKKLPHNSTGSSFSDMSGMFIITYKTWRSF
ncbi:uncharacterized protein V1516DRAFT_678468 [Lipomyces oligophaga]|uniref:uncharacterized protein n=1 Tax=Lipomyces oligophaga TaxID=45792 RepID=UPI0034CD2BF0